MQPSLDSLLADLSACRHRTLQLIEGITPTVLTQQAHPDFSPVGWHLGHIAYTEALWILGQDVKETRNHHQTLFAADSLPKAERQNLPPLTNLLSYLETVREQTTQKIKQCQPRLIHWLLQHEGQHAETIAMVQALHSQHSEPLLNKLPSQPTASSSPADSCNMVKIAAGEYRQGADADWAIDNEIPAHSTHVNAFWIDKALVTCGQFAQFMAMGGYDNEKWWSAAGWHWQQKEQIRQPLYWSDDPAFEDKPVCGVSWYEADAYARSRGKRLPTESEWEKAATNRHCQGMLGGVWEWTDTWFDGYQGFQPFPYEGYSQAYFDGAHRVLKGGSWASPPSVIRKSFRNWYHPHRRELFAGFRCAQ